MFAIEEVKRSVCSKPVHPLDLLPILDLQLFKAFRRWAINYDWTDKKGDKGVLSTGLYLTLHLKL